MDIEFLQNLLFEMDNANELVMSTSVKHKRGLNGMMYYLEVIYAKKVMRCVPSCHKVCGLAGKLSYKLYSANEIDECTFREVFTDYTTTLTAFLMPTQGEINYED